MGGVMAVLFCLMIFDHFRLTSRVSTLEQTANRLLDEMEKLRTPASVPPPPRAYR
jgi:hypothetical protein